ncbi:unnamed protein product [Caretta caretta]
MVFLELYQWHGCAKELSLNVIGGLWQDTNSLTLDNTRYLNWVISCTPRGRLCVRCSPGVVQGWLAQAGSLINEQECPTVKGRKPLKYPYHEPNDLVIRASWILQ